jgi:hypothetical protein
LKYYPKDALKKYMKNFRQMLYEDLLENPTKTAHKTLQSAFMTTFGWEPKLLEGIVKSGV